MPLAGLVEIVGDPGGLLALAVRPRPLADRCHPNHPRVPVYSEPFRVCCNIFRLSNEKSPARIAPSGARYKVRGNQGGGSGRVGLACAMLIVRVNTANAMAAKTRENRRIFIPPGRFNMRSLRTRSTLSAGTDRAL